MRNTQVVQLVIKRFVIDKLVIKSCLLNFAQKV